MRDQEQKHFALTKLLREYGLSNEPLAHMGLDENDKFGQRYELTIAFSTGWEEAQKWEVEEAERNAIANQAMVGLLSGDASNYKYDNDELVMMSYQLANKMIRARKQ